MLLPHALAPMGDWVGDNTSQSPGKEGVTTRTAGMQLSSQELHE